MSLVNELIKGLLPEEEKKKVVAVYGGGFKPPTSGHFEVVKQALKENPEIDEFIILIGGKPRNGITPDESILIWDIYKTYLPFKVEVKYTSVPPIKGIYNYAKEHPDEEVLFIIGAREGNEDDFADIATRTKSLDKYPNLNLRTIVTQGGVSGTAARNASKISLDKFKSFVPSELSDEEVEQVYNIVADKIQENKPQDGKAAPYGSGYDEVEEGRKKKKDPKKGTGKKPKKSERRLYTDEDPKDTIGIKFSTRQDIVDTLNKKSFKAKSHARQSQIINLIHQRVRAAYGRAKDPAVKKRLKTGLDYITKKKEASKAKTQRLKKQKLKENASYTNNIDIMKMIDDFTRYMIYNGMNITPLPTLELKDGDTENAKDFFGKTAYYDPNKQHIVLYTEGRHPKDIVRSYAHEMIHHIQHLEDRLGDVAGTDTTSSEHLTKLEKEANLKGTMTFRNWTDTILNEGKKKDPFGLMAYAQELGRLREEESEYKVYLDMDGVLADFDQRFRDLSGMEPRDFENKYGKKAFWNLIDEENKIKFWVGIPIMSGAADLVDAVKDYNYELLTSPSAKKQSYLGKILWVKNHTGNVFPSKPRINFKKAKEKHLVKPQLAKTDILIDDREDTIGRWNTAGGTGIVYKNIGQVLSDLKKLGLVSQKLAGLKKEFKEKDVEPFKKFK
jgi:proteasome assembly chaperone (PAC2) family protein